MIIQPVSALNFQSKLKNLYKKGKLPVKMGIYGEELTRENVSDEHIICKCYGGSNSLFNIALASKEKNNARGNQPIGRFLTIEMIKCYLRQFRGIRLNEFNGDSYIKGIKDTFNRIIDSK